MKGAYYNEWEPFAAVWLRNLIAAGELPPGDVDERSVMEVRPDDLKGYTQCHFFAGIGGWPYALRLAGWPDDRPVWSASLPCQPFSVAGKRQGEADERHLWPAFRALVDQCRPPSLVGEQVASADGRAWLAGVRADLEGMGYRVGAADLCAASVGAPHIRQRLFWVAESNGARLQRHKPAPEPTEGWVAGRVPLLGDGGAVLGVADASGERRDGEPVRLRRRRSQQAGSEIAGGRATLGLGDTDRSRHGSQRDGATGRGESERNGGDAPLSGRGGYAECSGGTDDEEPVIAPCPEIPDRWHVGDYCVNSDGLAALRAEWEYERAYDRGMGHAESKRFQGRPVECVDPEGREETERPAGFSGGWANAIWLPCLDGKARRIEPGLEPLVDGLPGRVGRLRAYGNAIVPQVAAEFIQAYLEASEAQDMRAA